MKYAIEFDIPDNETTRKSIKTDRVQWRFLGYGGYCMAQPVTHAHWTYEIDDLFPADSMMICSNCGQYERLGANDNYCGHCGAKMDEEVKTDE